MIDSAPMLLTLGAATVAAALVIWAVSLSSRLRRLEQVFKGESEPEAEALRPVMHRLSEMTEAQALNLRRVGLSRYDAFGDASGNVSFSVALLNERSDGVMITCLNGRTESRTYAKEIVAGTSDQALSDDERQAVDRARYGSDSAT